MNRAGLIDEFLDGIQQRIVGAWDFVFDPLWKWYAIGFIIFICCVVIAYFAPFKWIRAGLGVFLVIVGAFILGGRTMHKQMKSTLDVERSKRRELERQKPKEQGGPFSGWFGS